MSHQGAVYCRVAHRQSARQVGIDQREAGCRELTARQGIAVAPRRVFLDPQATSWTATGTSRPGWEGLLRELGSGRVTHAVVFDVHELGRRRPEDLDELLTLVERHALVLLDPVAPDGGAELNRPAARHALLERARSARRGRRRLADSVRAAQAEEASSGRPHGGGRRAYGYTLGDYDLVPEEADVVDRVFTWFLTGRTLSWIARALTDECVPTAAGGRWTSTKVGRIIDAPRYAGLRVRAGEIVREADGTPVRAAWKPCVSVADWEAARALRGLTRQSARENRPAERHYPLTGLVRCGRCGHPMVGSAVDDYPTYACTGRRVAGRAPCFRYISATRLEELVDEEVLGLLDAVDAREASCSAPAAVLDARTAETRRRHQARLAELVELLEGGVPSADDQAASREREEVAARIRAENRAVVLRAPDAVADLGGGRLSPSAWRRMAPSQQAEVRRYLIGRIEIGPVTGPRSVFDPDRVRLVPHAC
ncbi:recombinase family protein [Streptacidiphilus anmyonensis]|uniref:recombinase family protein n=1 Tax=Streptacidiphilus anmyonensis TaxID=405782 RepID=UPI0005AB32B6|nr:recombinase family protein [Streptacidiphilus anmyonensis]